MNKTKIWSVILYLLSVVIINSPLPAQESSVKFGSKQWIVEGGILVNKPGSAINDDIVKMGALVQSQLGFSPRLAKWNVTGDINALIGRKVTNSLIVGISADFSTGSIGNDETYRQIPFQIPQIGTIPVDINQHFKNKYTDKVLSLNMIYYFTPGRRISPYIQGALTHHWFESITDLDFSIAALSLNRLINVKLNETAIGFTPIAGVDIYLKTDLLCYFKLSYPMATIKGPAGVKDNTNSVIQNYRMDSKIKLDGFGIYVGFGYSFGRIL